MAATASRPGIHAMLDAYALLEVEHSANPAEIRQAYKRLARTHHPDRRPVGSPEQRQATERMTAINAAYQLARDAPLRYHRVSTAARPDEPWTDTEWDAAIRRAHRERVSSTVAGFVLVAAAVLLPWFIARLAGYQVSLPYLLDDFQDVRTIEDHPAFGGQGVNQAPQHQRGRDIETGIRLVEHEDLRIVQQRGGHQNLLPHAFRVPDIGACRSSVNPKISRNAAIFRCSRASGIDRKRPIKARYSGPVR